MNKKIIFILVILTFLTACSGSSQQGSGSGNPDGLHITFLEFQPRDNLKENEVFDIGLRLENKAECNIEGEVCIRDTLSESLSGVQDSCQSFSLRKKEDSNIDSENIYFQDNLYEFLSGDLRSTIIAKSEYSCSIQLTPQLCVKPNIEDEGICKTKETISSSALGLKQAPITVSKIEKVLIPQRDGMKLEVAIHLKKMSEGESNNFNIGVEYEGHGVLNCRNLDRLDFKKNTENIINCEIPVSIVDIEENPLKITLNYIYETKESKQINIIKEEGDR
tara:strand:+ start:1318 stop:2148 length:831 start_codon:yes stop_codon:yes gene_type:complete